MNGVDYEMGEEGQHRRSDVATITIVVGKSTIGGPIRKQWQIAAEGTLGNPPGNMHSPAFRLLTDRDRGGACTSSSTSRGNASSITGVLTILTFLSLTLSKRLFTSHQMSRIVGQILRFGFFPKMEKYWAVPPISMARIAAKIPVDIKHQQQQFTQLQE